MKLRINLEGPKRFWQATTRKVRGWWQWFNEKTQCDGNPMTDAQPPYPNCKNCGTELSGMYCHKCGQYASQPLSLSHLIKEYVKNILALERQALPTLCNLIFQPGRLAQEFCAGRYMSYLHPLKMHLFILVVLFALFAFFGTDDKIEGSMTSLSNQNTFITEMTLSSIKDNEEYLSKVMSSPRDTAIIVAPSVSIDKHPDLINVVEVISYHEDRETLDTLRVTLPNTLVSDSIMYEQNGVLHFAPKNRILNEEMMLAEISEVWSALTTIIFGHFPLLALLTMPLLRMAIQLILRRKRRPRVFTSIFSIYYLTFVELLFTVLYSAGIIFKFSYADVRWLVLFTLFTYLTVALKRAYEISSWFRAMLAATVVNIFYFVACVIYFSLISFFIIMATVA
ncbi:MAG: DUF3667 domain-containing protein [Rikenellaceae bacterium]|nr:DUF3667 domain-containing protein [Rikenellaceae bacterium]